MDEVNIHVWNDCHTTKSELIVTMYQSDIMSNASHTKHRWLKCTSMYGMIVTLQNQTWLWQCIKVMCILLYVTVLWCFVHVCFVQVTILKLVWRSRHVDEPRSAHFPIDICSVIQEGEITVEMCALRGASVCRDLDETNMDITTVHRMLHYHLNISVSHFPQQIFSHVI